MARSPLRRVFSWVGPAQDQQSSSLSPTPDAMHFRRSSRVKASVLVRVSGQDETGASFGENTRTLEVGKHGAKIPVSRRLSPGTELRIANLDAGRTAPARVIWSSAAPNAQQLFSTGVEVTEPDNPELVWAIETPPVDWLEGCAPPTADERLDYLCQRARSDRPADETKPEPAKAAGNGGSAAHRVSAPPGRLEASPVSAPLDAVQPVPSPRAGVLDPPGPDAWERQETAPPRPGQGRAKLTLLGLATTPRETISPSLVPSVSASPGGLTE